MGPDSSPVQCLTLWRSSSLCFPFLWLSSFPIRDMSLAERHRAEPSKDIQNAAPKSAPQMRGDRVPRPGSVLDRERPVDVQKRGLTSTQTRNNPVPARPAVQRKPPSDRELSHPLRHALQPFPTESSVFQLITCSNAHNAFCPGSHTAKFLGINALLWGTWKWPVRGEVTILTWSILHITAFWNAPLKPMKISKLHLSIRWLLLQFPSCKRAEAALSLYLYFSARILNTSKEWQMPF